MQRAPLQHAQVDPGQNLTVMPRGLSATTRDQESSENSSSGGSKRIEPSLTPDGCLLMLAVRQNQRLEIVRPPTFFFMDLLGWRKHSTDCSQLVYVYHHSEPFRTDPLCIRRFKLDSKCTEHEPQSFKPQALKP